VPVGKQRDSVDSNDRNETCSLSLHHPPHRLARRDFHTSACAELATTGPALLFCQIPTRGYTEVAQSLTLRAMTIPDPLADL
jgi:hypothetical protein